VFAAKGYAAARVEDVVAAAGVSHGTFYTYFDNKAGALDALIDQAGSQLQAVLDAPWEGPDGPGTIEAVIDRFVTVYGDHGDVVRVWIEASAHEPHFGARLAQVRAGFVGRVAEVLAPVLRPTPHDAEVAATALVAMVEGYATQHGTPDDPTARRVVVRTLTELWTGGLIRLAEGPDGDLGGTHPDA
jgi:AcrR family transcriptional regulator